MKNDRVISEFKSSNGCLHYLHSIADTPEVVPVEHHSFYEINYFISGKIRRFVEGREYPSNKGDLLFINDRELHRIGSVSDLPYERIVIHFDKRILSGIDTEGYNVLDFIDNRKAGIGNMITCDDINKTGIISLFSKIEEYKKKNTSDSPLLIKITFLNILAKINALYNKNKGIINTPIHNDERVSKILDYIHENLERKLTLEKISSEFNINKYHLCHLFKKATGFTLIEYITNKRIYRTKEYLLKGLPVIESCYKAGFSDYSNFYRIFKRATGVTPKQFVKKNYNML